MAPAESAITIREAAPSDAPHLARLSTMLGYPAIGPEIHARLMRLLASPRDRVLVAQAPSGEVVGWLHGYLCQLLEADLRVEIGGLIVDPRWRRFGLGRELVGALERWGGAQGAVEMSVRCRQDRVEAHAFYRNLAFTDTKVQQVFRRAIGAG